MDSPNSCEVVVLDGQFCAAEELHIADNRNDDGTSSVAGVWVVESNPIGLTATITLSHDYEDMYDNVHVTVDDMLYMFEDAVVNNFEKTLGEPWADVSMSASKMSVRKL